MIPCTVTAEELGARLATVRRRIEAAGGDPERVRVVGVTKGFDGSAIERARSAGLLDLGESYAQELTAKATAGDGTPAIRWHWVGRLQRNKVRPVAPLVTVWHSIDRAELGAEVARRAPGATVLAQVNTSGEPTKGGCRPEEAAALVADLRADGLDVVGLMTVAAPGAEAARAGFRTLRALADDLGVPERSMGMSDDLEAAVAEGSTLVRVGTALFGPRGASVAFPSETTS